MSSATSGANPSPHSAHNSQGLSQPTNFSSAHNDLYSKAGKAARCEIRRLFPGVDLAGVPEEPTPGGGRRTRFSVIVYHIRT